MDNEKKSISITISNIDDMQVVFKAFDNLFRKLLLYYAEKEDMESIELFVLSIAQYFGEIMKKIGYNEEDFKNE